MGTFLQQQSLVCPAFFFLFCRKTSSVPLLSLLLMLYPLVQPRIFKLLAGQQHSWIEARKERQENVADSTRECLVLLGEQEMNALLYVGRKQADNLQQIAFHTCQTCWIWSVPSVGSSQPLSWFSLKSPVAHYSKVIALSVEGLSLTPLFSTSKWNWNREWNSLYHF